MICPTCAGDGGGCPACGGAGRFAVTRDPSEILPAWVDTLALLVDWAEAGAMPVAGGALDQTRWFLAAAQFVRHERSYWKAELKLME